MSYDTHTQECPKTPEGQKTKCYTGAPRKAEPRTKRATHNTPVGRRLNMSTGTEPVPPPG